MVGAVCDLLERKLLRLGIGKDGGGVSVAYLLHAGLVHFIPPGLVVRPLSFRVGGFEPGEIVRVCASFGEREFPCVSSRHLPVRGFHPELKFGALDRDPFRILFWRQDTVGTEQSSQGFWLSGPS